MIINKDKVVSIEYTLTDLEGNLVDSSENSEVFTYIHGYEMTLPGIEEVLDGKEEGFSYSGTIPCEKAYGKRDKEYFIPVPKSEFKHIDNFSIGMKILIVNNFGDEQEMEVVDMDDNSVTIDANSPWADKDLNLELKVLEVREVTPEELKEMEEESHHHHGPDCGCKDH